MSTSCEVAIIGAGPYGLSTATHLRAHGIGFRIFGRPMHSWCAHMPKGMFLKSEGFASNLYDPEDRYTLKRFCLENGLAYADTDVPVPLDTFVAYGRSFQQKLVPGVEDKSVVALDRAANGFSLGLDDGETLTARRVVVAVGLNYFQHVPQALSHLPANLLSHSSAHHDVSRFKGRSVSVIGGGSSALDLVAALQEVGADVRLIARRHSLRWNLPLSEQLGQMRWYPVSGLGHGWRNYFFEHGPMLFRGLPTEARMYIVREWLGPAGGWPVKNSVEQAELLLGHTLKNAQLNSGDVHLRVADRDGQVHDLTTEHVIAATGYKVDVRALRFFADGLVDQLRTIEHAPILSQNFQSTVPGLYFVGLTAANCFGPIMRFLLGARHSARRLAKHFTNASH